LQATYKNILTWALERPKKMIALALVSLFANGLLLPFLGTEFQPTYDSGEFSIAMTAPAGTSLEKMQQLVAPIEQKVLAIPERDISYTLVGSNGLANKATIGELKIYNKLCIINSCISFTIIKAACY
jgi:HAE1 family hydrophobic/amphiphilic exporter-1